YRITIETLGLVHHAAGIGPAASRRACVCGGGRCACTAAAARVGPGGPAAPRRVLRSGATADVGWLRLGGVDFSGTGREGERRGARPHRGEPELTSGVHRLSLTRSGAER